MIMELVHWGVLNRDYLMKPNDKTISLFNNEIKTLMGD